ncbi:hypothetical protein [Paraburkholderia saeva]|uniref:Lipoprotein n=1 Tax=Paraburkholderia saeva TaxID=2777537 RepID=A0A9N8RYH4_9BURK|nr:hypothetical protein [Paraburkholderia saeva]CAG4905932.1 hypothetical protein LMG31841_03505 [Paraburkholderia saeva]
MKRSIMLLAAGLVASIAFGGCTSLQQQTVATLAAGAQKHAKDACAIVQPVLLNLRASLSGDDAVAQLTDDNGDLCKAVASLDPANVSSLVNTAIPEMIGLVALLPVDPGTATTIRISLGAASLALSNWLVVYGTPVAPIPASEAIAS